MCLCMWPFVWPYLCPYMLPDVSRQQNPRQLQNKVTRAAAAPETPMEEEKELEMRDTQEMRDTPNDHDGEEEKAKGMSVVTKKGWKGGAVTGVRQNAVLLREVCVGESGDGVKRRTCPRGWGVESRGGV